MCGSLYLTLATVHACSNEEGDGKQRSMKE
jgi:hypothetical protein